MSNMFSIEENYLLNKFTVIFIYCLESEWIVSILKQLLILLTLSILNELTKFTLSSYEHLFWAEYN